MTRMPKPAAPTESVKIMEVLAVPPDRLATDSIYVGVICHSCRGSIALIRDGAEGASKIFFADAPVRLRVMCPSCATAAEYGTADLVDVHVARAASAIPPN